MKIPIFQWLQIYSIKICDENEWRTTLKCSISSWNNVGLLQIVIPVLWMYRVLELSFCCCYEDCTLNRTVNALWLRQSHYNPLFTGTTEAAVRRWDGSSALSHRASTDCAITVTCNSRGRTMYRTFQPAFLFSFHSSARFPPAPVSLYRHRTAGRISRVFNGTSWLLL